MANETESSAVEPLAPFSGTARPGDVLLARDHSDQHPNPAEFAAVPGPAEASPVAPGGEPVLDRRIRAELVPLATGALEDVVRWIWSTDLLPVEDRRAALRRARWDSQQGGVPLVAEENVTRSNALRPLPVCDRVQRVWATGVDLAILTSRVQAQPAFGLLVALVNRLDHRLRRRARIAVQGYKRATLLPRSESKRALKLAQAERLQRALVREAVDQFLDLLSPQVRTAYFRDERTNRVSPLPISRRRADGLCWPEAMRGLSMFDDAPRAVLLDESRGPVWTHEELQLVVQQRRPLEGRGRFGWRERVNCTWAFRIAWDRCRVAAFCAWRDGAPKAPNGQQSPVGMTPARKRIYDEAWSSPRVAELALHYLTGWLRSTGMHVVGFPPPPMVGPRDVRTVMAAMLDNDAPAWSTLRSTLDSWYTTQHPTWTINTIGSSDGQQVVRLSDTDYPRAQSVLPILPPDGDVLVAGGNRGSVAAQAACWDAPLIIDDLQAPHHFRQDWRWADLDVPIKYAKPRRGKRISTRSELAVLVPGVHGPRAVIVGEHPDVGFFDENDLHRAQLLGLLAGACVDARVRAPDSSDSEHRQAMELRNIARTQIGSSQALLDEFTSCIRRLVGADLCYVLHYNPGSHAFSVASVAANRSLETDILKRMELQLSPTTLDRARPLLGHAMRAAIQPAGEGRTWEVYRRLREIAQVNEPEVKPLGPPLDFEYPTRITIPITARAGAAADGVLWLRWRETPAALLDGDGAEGNQQDRLAKAVALRGGRMLGVLAAALVLMRPDPGVRPETT